MSSSTRTSWVRNLKGSSVLAALQARRTDARNPSQNRTPSPPPPVTGKRKIEETAPTGRHALVRLPPDEPGAKRIKVQSDRPVFDLFSHLQNQQRRAHSSSHSSPPSVSAMGTPPSPIQSIPESSVPLADTAAEEGFKDKEGCQGESRGNASAPKSSNQHPVEELDEDMEGDNELVPEAAATKDDLSTQVGDEGPTMADADMDDCRRESGGNASAPKSAIDDDEEGDSDVISPESQEQSTCADGEDSNSTLSDDFYTANFEAGPEGQEYEADSEMSQDEDPEDDSVSLIMSDHETFGEQYDDNVDIRGDGLHAHPEGSASGGSMEDDEISSIDEEPGSSDEYDILPEPHMYMHPEGPVVDSDGDAEDAEMGGVDEASASSEEDDISPEPHVHGGGSHVHLGSPEAETGRGMADTEMGSADEALTSSDKHPEYNMQGDSLRGDSEGVAPNGGMEDAEMGSVDEESASSEEDDAPPALHTRGGGMGRQSGGPAESEDMDDDKMGSADEWPASSGEEDIPAKSRKQSSDYRHTAAQDFDVRHDDATRLQLKREVRHLAAELLDIPDSPLRVPTLAQLNAFHRSLKERDGPSLNDLCLDLDSEGLASQWNKRAGLLFARHFIASPRYTCTDPSVVAKAFAVHLATLRQKYRFSIRLDNEESDTETALKESLDKSLRSRRNRRRSLRHRRKEACESYKTDPSMKRFLPLWKTLPLEAMSGDESSNEIIPRAYAITVLPWRNPSPEITNWLRTFDHLHLSTRFGSDDRPRPGNFPHRRVPSQRIEAHNAAPPGLPRNFYNPLWLEDQDIFELETLKIQSPIDLTFSPDITFISARFAPVKNRKTPPLPRNHDTLPPRTTSSHSSSPPQTHSRKRRAQGRR